HLGSSREVISRILKEMENKGEIKRAYKKIILLKIKGQNVF
ncbi:helix-turn-helix domain-containing protein, partial [Helicobacter typhlonius]